MSTQNLHKFHGSIIHNSQKVETTQMSINRWIDNMWCIHTKLAPLPLWPHCLGRQSHLTPGDSLNKPTSGPQSPSVVCRGPSGDTAELRACRDSKEGWGGHSTGRTTGPNKASSASSSLRPEHSCHRQLPGWLSYPSLCPNITSSEKPPLTALHKTACPYHSLSHLHS